MKKCLSVLLLVVFVISLASVSCGKKNTAVNKDSTLNSRSVSTWISENNSSKRPFRLSAWKDNYHSCDLELTWRGDGSLTSKNENLLIGDFDSRNIDPPNYNKSTSIDSELTVSDGNYNGKIDFADYGVVGAGYNQEFSGFYLYWDKGNEQDIENLDDNNLHNEIGTSGINEAVTGFSFSSSRFTKLNNNDRNSYGFFEYNFKPMSDTPDGNGDYTIPLFNQGDYFVLVPFDFDGSNYTKKPEFAQQFQVKQFPPHNLELKWTSSQSKLDISWEDDDTYGDNWNLYLTCSVGKIVEGNSSTLYKTDLTTKNYTIYFDSSNLSPGTLITFKALVEDDYGLNVKGSATYPVDKIINSNVNKIWLTYKCINNPPKQGDFIYVYSYLQNPSYNIYGSIMLCF